jgi:hypothetical protein
MYTLFTAKAGDGPEARLQDHGLLPANEQSVDKMDMIIISLLFFCLLYCLPLALLTPQPQALKPSLF